MHVVIVGGGFGGIKTALELAKHKQFRVTLISDSKNFQYYPALFSTATGHDYRQSWVPLTEIFKGIKNVELHQDTAVSIDADAKIIKTESGTSYSYDEAVFALGSTTTYFGIKGLDTYSYGIKSEQEIRRLQAHIWEEMSDGSDDETNYVIIGAGPTGVELAGALGEYIQSVRKHFKITKKSMRISVIEAAPRVLPRLSEASSQRAEKRLKQLGVHVATNTKVEKQTADSLVVNGKPIKTQTVIWTSGVANVPFYGNNADQFELNDRGKVKVDEFMRARAHVYVIGDNANTPYAGLAQTALHDAIFIAKHLKGSKKTYKPKSPPCVVPIGHGWALFEWGKLRFGGWLGGILRRAADLVGYRDILPISWAVGAWRAGSKKQMRIPDKM